MWQIDGRKCLTYIKFFEKGHTENLKDFAETPGESKLFLEDRHEHVDADGNPKLGLHGVLRGAVEAFDPQVVLDPLEEQFDAPAAFVQLGDREGGQDQVVRQEDQALRGVDIDVADTPQGIRIGGRRLATCEHDRLVAAQAARCVDRSGRTAAVIEVALGPHDEAGQALREGIQAAVVDVTAIHDIEGHRFQHQCIEEGDIGHFPVGDSDKAGNRAPQIQERMELDCRFVLPKVGLGKERKAQIDRRGV